MSLLHSPTSMLQVNSFRTSTFFPSSSNKLTKNQRSSRKTRVGFQSCFNPFDDQPIIKDALKEPVAFMGGVFAGLLRLDLNEEPLKEWITRTVEASGMTPEELESARESKMSGEDDEAPLQIEIE